MMVHQTMEQLAEMKLAGILAGLREQLAGEGYADLSFEERLGLLVDKEYLLRENRRLTRTKVSSLSWRTAAGYDAGTTAS